MALGTTHRAYSRERRTNAGDFGSPSVGCTPVALRHESPESTLPQQSLTNGSPLKWCSAPRGHNKCEPSPVSRTSGCQIDNWSVFSQTRPDLSVGWLLRPPGRRVLKVLLAPIRCHAEKSAYTDRTQTGSWITSSASLEQIIEGRKGFAVMMLLKFTNPRLNCYGPSIGVNRKFDLGLRFRVLSFFFLRWLCVHVFLPTYQAAAGSTLECGENIFRPNGTIFAAACSV